MQDTLRRLLLSTYALLALSLTLLTLYLCYALEWRGPFRDLWDFMAEIERQLNGNWDFGALIEPYGGIHRILLPKLLFYLDYRFAAGSNLLALSVSIALHITACIVFIRSILQYQQINRQDKMVLIPTVLLFFFSTTQIYNLIYISDNQVVISNTLAVVSAWFFSRGIMEKNHKLIVLANGILLLACLSHSSSLMLLPAALLMMCLSGFGRKVIVIQLLWATGLLAFYVSGEDPLRYGQAIPDPLWKRFFISSYNTLANIDDIARYIGLHLGSPTSRKLPLAGIVISYVSIAYLACIAWRLYKKSWQPGKSEIFWITLAFYGFFIAFITATGRQIYPNSALTDRYQTLVMTYWAAMIVILYIDLKTHANSFRFAAPIFTLALLLPYQEKSANEMAWLSSRVNVAHTAAIVGITDIDTIAATLSHPLLMQRKNLVHAHNDFLRKNQLGYFSEDSARYFLDREANSIFSETISSSEDCQGKLISIFNIKPDDKNSEEENFRFQGEGYIGAGKMAESILAIDNNKKIVGLGYAYRDRGELILDDDIENQPWIGFIHSHQPIAYPLAFVAKTAKGYCQPAIVPTEQ